MQVRNDPWDVDFFDSYQRYSGIYRFIRRGFTGAGLAQGKPKKLGFFRRTFRFSLPIGFLYSQHCQFSLQHF
jgi:hypothetical protein